MRHSIFKKLFLPVLLMMPLTGFADTDKYKAKESYYDLSVELTDQDGKTVDLDVFRGQPVVVSMFYASCNYTCPLLIDALKAMDAKLDDETRKNVRVLLITFDPENDTPDVLKKLAKEHKIDLTRWKMVVPKKEEVREIAALLDYSYRTIPSGGFNHTSSLTLLDAQGVLVSHEEGLVEAADAITKKLVSGVK